MTDSGVATTVAPSVAPEQGAGDYDQVNPLLRARGKAFDVQAGYELHFNAISDDYGANDWYSYFSVLADWNITRRDQIRLYYDMYQRYLVDPDESSLWPSELRLYYSRKFQLPIPEFPIPGKASFYLTAPVSRASQDRGIITEPTVVLSLAPGWGPFTLTAQTYLRTTLAQYATTTHGALTSMLSTAARFQLQYSPVDWFAPTVNWYYTWTKPYADREGNPQDWQRDYYLELALNFAIPLPQPAPELQLTLAYAQGANVLEDGVQRYYLAKRDQSELYFGINLSF